MDSATEAIIAIPALLLSSLHPNINQKMSPARWAKLLTLVASIVLLFISVNNANVIAIRPPIVAQTIHTQRNLKSVGKADANHALIHIAASGIAAVINFPLWRASAIAQSGFQMSGGSMLQKYWQAIQPPYRGVLATMFGMCWARAAIFYGSEVGKNFLLKNHINAGIAQTAPTFIISTLVQVINMPIVRATITIQDPESEMSSVTEALVHIYQTRGLGALWHGVSAAILKTVPKYITAVVVKDFMEDNLPPADPSNKYASLGRSAVKAVTAGVAGAALTNPLDVLRNEMFKTNLSLGETLRNLVEERGWGGFMCRGIKSNIVAVAIPIALTIFTTDLLLSWQDSAQTAKQSRVIPQNQRDNTVEKT